MTFMNFLKCSIFLVVLQCGGLQIQLAEIYEIMDDSWLNLDGLFFKFGGIRIDEDSERSAASCVKPF